MLPRMVFIIGRRLVISVLWVAGWRDEFLRTIGFIVARPHGFNDKHPNRAGYGGKRGPFKEQPAKINLDSVSHSRIRIGRRAGGAEHYASEQEKPFYRCHLSV